jgi:hypothetical protein
MRMRWEVRSGALLLGGLIAAVGATAAERSESRAETRARVEQRLVVLEERQGLATAEEPVGEAQLSLSRQYLDLAQKALKWGNERAAQGFADKAERCLAQLEPQEESQGTGDEAPTEGQGSRVEPSAESEVQS